MKKLFFTLFAVLLLAACSSDDDASSNETGLQTQLLGVWQYTSVSFNGELVDLEEGHCILDNKITYLENDELIYDAASAGFGNICEYATFESFWLVQSENSYLSTEPGDDVGIEYTVDFLSENEIILSYEDSFDDLFEIGLIKTQD